MGSHTRPCSLGSFHPHSWRRPLVLHPRNGIGEPVASRIGSFYNPHLTLASLFVSSHSDTEELKTAPPPLNRFCRGTELGQLAAGSWETSRPPQSTSFSLRCKPTPGLISLQLTPRVQSSSVIGASPHHFFREGPGPETDVTCSNGSSWDHYLGPV